MALAHYYCRVNNKDEIVVVDSTILPFLSKGVFTNFSELSKYIADMRKQHAPLLP